ncbi:MAG: stage V sporulation protein S [Candidatus Berkelbacteria bacterium]|nr:stage V sporulation protein S [Candidatus Berkelbacteria bacterium]
MINVSAKSNPNKVAGALAGQIRMSKDHSVEMRTIGAGALNQAVKALAIARGFMAPAEVDLVMRPAFIDVEIGGVTRTAIRHMVEGLGFPEEN